ncbi:MAG TPA: dTMP kinase [Gaiellaceae bacterium]|nr:dTMP kinase [Gaiellaceae bacterium]
MTFEGIGGAGKTTQAELLKEALEAEGGDVLLTREPGGTPLGERLRELLLYGDEISPWTEAGLFMAARAELVHGVIAPALERGMDVVCDRYVDSSLAYQGIARGLGVERILDLNLPAIRGLLPDRTFFLAIDVEVAQDRREKSDRIERSDRDAMILDRAYRELAQLFPRRIVTVEAGKPAREVAGLIREQLRDLP